MEDIKSKKHLLRNKINQLNNHKLLTTNKLDNLKSLKIFMEHHVYAVWDFMSILKSLQHHICPSDYPWRPNEHTTSGIARLINEIVLAEESDEIAENKYLSHFDLYIQAMTDIGADTSKVNNLLNHTVHKNHFYGLDISDCGKDFISVTYELLSKNKLHITAALFTYGRETTLPNMFRSILNMIKVINGTDYLQLYLKRHIEIDSNRHGPLSVKLYENSVNNDYIKEIEALDAAIIAVESRIKLWTCISKEIS